MLVAEVIVHNVEKQPVPQVWTGGGKAPVAITAVCKWNRTHPNVSRPQRVTTTIRWVTVGSQVGRCHCLAGQRLVD